MTARSSLTVVSRAGEGNADALLLPKVRKSAASGGRANRCLAHVLMPPPTAPARRWRS